MCNTMTVFLKTKKNPTLLFPYLNDIICPPSLWPFGKIINFEYVVRLYTNPYQICLYSLHKSVVLIPKDGLTCIRYNCDAFEILREMITHMIQTLNCLRLQPLI